MLLVSGCTVSTQRLLPTRPDRLGVLLTPSNGNREWWGPECVWAADNDCFRGLDAPAFLRMLAKLVGYKTRPAWVSCPDVVGDAAETLRRFRVWGPLVRELGMRAALVGQDGLTPPDVPWGDADGFFVGGSTAWKLSDDAARLTLEAHGRGLPVHYGRVNTLRRILWLGRGIRDGRLWCDTFDGTGFSAYGDKRIPLAIRWIDAAMADRQAVMFGGVA